MFISHKIEVKDSPSMNSGEFGNTIQRGVFAKEDISAGEVVEVSPILVLQHEDFVETRWNLLFEYYFWLDDFVVLALGYGSMYNHAVEPNVSYQIDVENQTITFTAIKDIKKGEELFFNYKGSSTESAPLWFERKV